MTRHEHREAERLLRTVSGPRRRRRAATAVLLVVAVALALVLAVELRPLIGW